MKKLFSECWHKDLNNKSGIYKIICNKHNYIGSSKNIYYRLKRHISDLRKNKHSNKFMQNVYNKYNDTIFYFEIIELCNEESLIKKETEYIHIIKPDLNLDLNPIKRTFTKESIKQISETLKNGYKSGRIKNPLSKIVYRYDQTGVYLDQFNSCSEAKKLLNIKSNKISKAARGTINSAGGFIWSYVKYDKLIKVIEQNKKVKCIDKNENIIDTWISVKDLAKHLGISHSATSIRISKGNFYNNLKYEFY